MMEDRPGQVTDNAAGDQFEPGAYWKLLEASGEGDRRVHNECRRW